MKLDYDSNDIKAEIKLLSLIVEGKAPGEYKAMEIIDENCEFFDDHVAYGLRLRQFVADGKIPNLEAAYVQRGSNHWVYDIKGGEQPAD